MSGSGFQKLELPPGTTKFPFRHPSKERWRDTVKDTYQSRPPRFPPPPAPRCLSAEARDLALGGSDLLLLSCGLQSLGSGMRRMNEESLADGDVCDPLWDSGAC